MNRTFFLFLLFFPMTFIACRKDAEVDYRNNYMGEYELYVHIFHWEFGLVPYWTEDTIIGKVFKYDSTQYYSQIQHHFTPYNSPEETKFGMSIMYLENAYTNCYVYESGLIRSASGYHYHHQGYFTGDSLYFDVTGLGGLGGGVNIYTRGRKLN